MITAHLPSGYVLGRALPSALWMIPAALIGAILPDIDLLWFYLVDDRSIHHHRYWVHVPAFWAALAVVILPLTPRTYRPAAGGFFLALILHICLDSIAGDIMWHWPFDDRFTHLVTVPAIYDNWILNFFLHPVFALEIVIWAMAIVLWVKR